MNYSVHFIVTNIVFIFTGSPLSWGCAIALTSFYQLISYFYNTKRMFQKIFVFLSNPPRCPQMLATFEIMSLFSPIGRLQKGKAVFIIMFIRMQFYLFWFLLYRYATDSNHQLLWSSFYTSFFNLVNKLPAFISRFLIKIPNSFSQFGVIARRIYQIKYE